MREEKVGLVLSQKDLAPMGHLALAHFEERYQEEKQRENCFCHYLTLLFAKQANFQAYTQNYY